MGDLGSSGGGAGAAYMLGTLLTIFGILGFCVGRCGRRYSRGSSSARSAQPAGAAGQAQDEGGPGLLPFHVFWRALQMAGGGRNLGLGDAAIAALPLTKLARAAQCAVCLGEVAAGEAARLLPMCGHRFHVGCVDTWLRSRANCPICRETVVVDVNEMLLQAETAPAPAQAQAQAEGPILLPQADGGRAPLAGARDGGGEGIPSLLLEMD